MRKFTILFLFLFLCFGISASIAQNDSTEVIVDMRNDNSPPPKMGNADTGGISELTTENSIAFQLSMLVLAFGLVIIGLETFLIMKKKIEADNIVRFIVVTLIIIAALFLITAGYSNDQIAPAMGLMGAIAGYLIGKSEKEKSSDKPTA